MDAGGAPLSTHDDGTRHGTALVGRSRKDSTAFGTGDVADSPLPRLANWHNITHIALIWQEEMATSSLETRASIDDRSRMNTVGLKMFFRLATEWGLNRQQQITLLGQPSERTFYRWRSGQVVHLPHDTLERISVLIGIREASHLLLPVPERANAWVKRPNAALEGRSALEVMLMGRVEHLYQVRRLLESWNA